MGTTVGGTGLAPNEGADRRHVKVVISALAFKALTGDSEVVDPSLRMESALLCYLRDGDSGQPAWPYPGFLRGSETQADVEIDLEVASDLWRDLEQEAIRQGVTVEQMAEHASFYFAAELDAGRVTQRILDDLESTEGSGEGS